MSRAAKVLFVAALALAGVPEAEGRSGLPLANPVLVGGCPPGPGNIVNGALFFVSMRAYVQSQCNGTTPDMIIRRASDNTTKTINILTTGLMDVATATTFCQSTTCYVTTWYDLTGNGWTFTQAVNANQPQLTFSKAGGLPAVTLVDGSTSIYLGTTTVPAVSYNQPLSHSAVFQSNWTVSSSNVGDRDIYGYFHTPSTVNVLFGTYIDSFTHAGGAPSQTTGVLAYQYPSTVYAIQGVLNGSSSQTNVNGVVTSYSTPGAGYFQYVGGTTYSQIGTSGIYGSSSGGYLSELGYWNVAFSAGQQAQLLASQKSTYKISIPSYVGPLDQGQGPVYWWIGLRGASGAYAAPGTNPGVNIRRASDNATTDIAILSNGNLDTATAATFCNSTTCYVTKVYDQSGTGSPMSQGTNAYQPQLVFNFDGSLPAAYMNSNNSGWGASGSTSCGWTAGGGNPSWVSLVAQSNGAAGNYYAAGYAGNNITQIFNGNTFGPGGGGQDFSATATSGTTHAISANMTGGTSYINVDGSETSGTSGHTAPPLGGQCGIAGWNQTPGYGGYLMEYTWGPQGTMNNSTIRNAMRANEKAYWSTP